MRIAVLGCGAMGSLFSGYLSQNNQVTVIDVNKDLIKKINSDGLIIEQRDGNPIICHPKATIDSSNMKPVDLLIVFVKAMYSAAALEKNKALIDENTYIMSLQNGMGHEELLSKYSIDKEHVVLGTTQHNASIQGLGVIRHNGKGKTVICNLTGGNPTIDKISKLFTNSGIDTTVDANIKKMIWNKLFTNISASVLTGILQVKLGFIVENPQVWSICQCLIKEAVDVANAEGMNFSYEEKVEEVRKVCENTPDGITSIYADLRDKKKTEVDTISNSVVNAGIRIGIPTPVNRTMVQLVHAIEAKTIVIQ